MKLLQLNVTANWGSTGKIAEGIGKTAMARGWDSTIAYGRYMNSSESNLIKVGNQLDVYAHYAKSRLFDGEGLGSKSATRKLISRIKELNPDIIHLHNIHDHWLNYPILFEYLASITTPIVWTFHDCWAFTGGCFHFIQNKCFDWETKCIKCYYKKLLTDNTERNFNSKIGSILSLGKRLTIISVSKWLNAIVSDSKIKSLKQRTIYNGVDTNIFKPQSAEYIDSKYSLEGKKIFLGVSNRWYEDKGLKDFIKLSFLLPSNYFIVLVGVTEDIIKTLPKKIIGIPRTDSVEELAAFYTRADAVLSLSSAETFGMTLAEGLSCGTPAIAYASTGMKEIITPETGFLIPPGDISQLKAVVEAVASRKVIFSAEDCRKRAVENFNQDIQFNKYIDLYEELLSNS